MFPQMIMDQRDSHTHAYMYWDLTKAAKSIHITQKTVMFQQSCNVLSCVCVWGGCFSVSDVFLNFPFLLQFEFLRV